jgi:hypothetical protein
MQRNSLLANRLSPAFSARGGRELPLFRPRTLQVVLLAILDVDVQSNNVNVFSKDSAILILQESQTARFEGVARWPAVSSARPDYGPIDPLVNSGSLKAPTAAEFEGRDLLVSDQSVDHTRGAVEVFRNGRDRHNLVRKLGCFLQRSASMLFFFVRIFTSRGRRPLIGRRKSKSFPKAFTLFTSFTDCSSGPHSAAGDESGTRPGNEGGYEPELRPAHWSRAGGVGSAPHVMMGPDGRNAYGSIQRIIIETC